MADRSTALVAGLRPSSSDKWFHCPGYVAAVADKPSTSTIYTAGGTAEHQLAEICLSRDCEPERFLGTTIDAQGFDIDITQDRVDAVRQYLEYVRPFTTDGSVFGIEEKLDLSCIHPAIGEGTADFFVFHEADGGVLEVIDYKGGAGKVVASTGNTQFLHYAIGAAEKFKHLAFRKVRLTVVQPRVYDEPKSWEIDVVALWDWRVDLAEAAQKAIEPGAPRCAGHWCANFCAASGDCPEYRAACFAVAKSEFGDQPVPTDELTPADLADILEKAAMLEGWLKAVRAKAMRAMESGLAIPRHKLVAKAARRKWRDPKEAARALVSAGLDKKTIFAEPELRSPAQVEKLLPSKLRAETVGPLTFSESSGWTLVHENDGREAISPSCTEFPDL